MTIISFNFNKINAKKSKPIKGQIKIKNNINLKDVKPAEIGTGKEKTKALKIAFSFTSTYEPKIATLDIEGDLIYMGDAKDIKSAITSWGKNKKVPPTIAEEVLNNALSRCTVQALILSREIGLPPPIALPSVKTK